MPVKLPECDGYRGIPMLMLDALPHGFHTTVPAAKCERNELSVCGRVSLSRRDIGSDVSPAIILPQRHANPEVIPTTGIGRCIVAYASRLLL